GCGVAWEKLCSSPRNSAAIGPKTLFIGISYDDPDIAEPGKIRYDACMTVTEGFEPEACFEKQTIKGGKYAVLRHTGPHDGLLACYRWFYGEWLPGSGCEPASAPAFEIYRNFPGETPPEKLITDICIPLEE
ncbi:MAG TPA: AraC family transcriptional regulator, partial [Synergistaceae bacterium]|nr:AraC family transcriptional regulator [Synergistaceae bacterium]